MEGYTVISLLAFVGTEADVGLEGQEMAGNVCLLEEQGTHQREATEG